MLLFVLLACRQTAPVTPPDPAAAFPEVEATLRVFDTEVEAARKAFEASGPADPDDPAWIARKLAHMVEIDQRLRRLAPPAGQGEQAQQAYTQLLTPRWQAIDTAHTAELSGWVERHGWITISRFGGKASHDAWLIAQHADHDPAFQRAVLLRMLPLVVDSEVSATDFAYLFDRVAVADDKPQHYGTQGQCTPDGWVPRPLAYPDRVDALRAEVGLGSLEDYRALFDCAGTRAAADRAHQEGDWAGCQALYTEWASGRSGERAAAGLYNAACCAAQGGNPDAAFDLLDRALIAGWTDGTHLAADTDLATLHPDPRWAALITRLSPSPE